MSNALEQRKDALGDDVAEKRSAVDQNGSVSVIMPKDVADELGIEPGEPVLWKGHEGDSSVEVEPFDASALLGDAD